MDRRRGGRAGCRGLRGLRPGIEIHPLIHIVALLGVLPFESSPSVPLHEVEREGPRRQGKRLRGLFPPPSGGGQEGAAPDKERSRTPQSPPPGLPPFRVEEKNSPSIRSLCLHGPSLSTSWRGIEGEDSEGRSPQSPRAAWVQSPHCTHPRPPRSPQTAPISTLRGKSPSPQQLTPPSPPGTRLALPWLRTQGGKSNERDDVTPI